MPNRLMPPLWKWWKFHLTLSHSQESLFTFCHSCLKCQLLYAVPQNFLFAANCDCCFIKCLFSSPTAEMLMWTYLASFRYLKHFYSWMKSQARSSHSYWERVKLSRWTWWKTTCKIISFLCFEGRCEIECPSLWWHCEDTTILVTTDCNFLQQQSLFPILAKNQYIYYKYNFLF